MTDGDGTTVEIRPVEGGRWLVAEFSSASRPTVAMRMSPSAAARLARMLLEAARRADFTSIFHVGEEN